MGLGTSCRSQTPKESSQRSHTAVYEMRQGKPGWLGSPGPSNVGSFLPSWKRREKIPGDPGTLRTCGNQKKSCSKTRTREPQG